eukprot:6173273-Pleurochrysis_carterae.AAC.2
MLLPTKEQSTVSITSSQLSWDSSQISIRAWVDDVLAWIPSCEQSFAPLIEHGYVLTSHGRVIVTSKEHAIAVYPRICTPYSLHSPSQLEPTFNLSIASLPAAIRARTRSATSADASSAPTSLTLPTEPSDHYVISPEILANVDQQLMETILKTVESVATRNMLRDNCN